MTNQEVLKMLNDKMAEHGLINQGWVGSLNNRKRALGVCSFGRKEIKISKAFSNIISSDEILDTILHEIAHALVGPGMGHGRSWRIMCRKIGATPTRLANASVKPEYRYKCYCPNCGELKQYGFHRRPTRKFICSDCGAILEIRQ